MYYGTDFLNPQLSELERCKKNSGQSANCDYVHKVVEPIGLWG